MKNAHLTSAVDLFGKSYNLVRKNLNVYALVYAIPTAMVIAGVIQLIDDNQRHGWNWGHVFSSSLLGPNISSNPSVHTTSIILTAVLIFGAVVSYLLAIVLNLRIAQDQKPTFGSIWNEVTQDRLWAKLLGLGALTILIMIAGIMLLVIPFIVFLWRLFLAPYILVDKKTKIFDALAMSWNMTKGYAWPVYGIILFSIVLSISSIFPIIGHLIAFVLGTAYAVAPALRYQEIKKHS